MKKDIGLSGGQTGKPKIMSAAQYENVKRRARARTPAAARAAKQRDHGDAALITEADIPY